MNLGIAIFVTLFAFIVPVLIAFKYYSRAIYRSKFRVLQFVIPNSATASNTFVYTILLLASIYALVQVPSNLFYFTWFIIDGLFLLSAVALYKFRNVIREPGQDSLDNKTTLWQDMNDRTSISDQIKSTKEVIEESKKY